MLNDTLKANLLSLLGNKPHIYAILESVSKSGMSRKIRHFAIVDGEIRNIDYLIAAVLHYRRDAKSGAIIKKGCGIDMLFATVYKLSETFYGNGYHITYSWL